MPVDAEEAGGREQQNSALAPFLRAHRTLARDEAWDHLKKYVEGNVPSRWKSTLQLEVAKGLFARGYFVDSWEAAKSLWQGLNKRREVNSLLVADQALALLLDLAMGKGDASALQQLLADNEGRPYHGSLEGRLLRARQASWLIAHTGAQNVMCGPRALNAILNHAGMEFDPIRLDKITADYIATGLPMSEVQTFAGQLGWPAQMVRRQDPAAPVPVPSVLHTKEGHYCAVLEADEAKGQYFLQDKGLEFNGWVSREAIEQMSSGNFVVAAGAMPTGFSGISEAQGAGLFGRDGTHPTGPTDEANDAPVTTGGQCNTSGMAGYTLLPQLAAVRLMDNPVGYDPPVGPSVRFMVSNNELDTGSPAAPAHSNVGRLWTVNWVSWIEPPTGTLVTGSAARIRPPGGGTRVVYYNAATQQFGPHDRQFTITKRISSTNYELLHPDGSRDVYDVPNNAANPTKLYLRQQFDPQGNGITFTYDAQLRLTTVTDAIGQQTSLFYEHPTDSLKITRVRDPFTRQATLAYNAAGQLTSITDVIGLVSSFVYSTAGDFVEKLTTPYGDTLFAKTQGSSAWDRTIEVTDTRGDKERVQYADPGTAIETGNPPPRTFFAAGKPVAFFAENSRLQFRNSYYWGKVAMATAPGDVKAARNYRWYTDTNWNVQPIIEAIKEPLEDRVWFNYPGASGAQKTAGGSLPNYPGKGARPEKILRVLADGSPQVVQMAYNANGLPTRTIDPLGRSTDFTYAANGLDLTEARQTTGGASQRLTAITYNSQHLPLTVTDAAGQVTTLTYNARGQALTVTNANNEVTSFTYNANGYLTGVDGPLPGTGDTTSFTYDANGRPRTVTGPDGYALTYDYDDFDRVTKITYPDATYEAFTYNRLDRVSRRDRLARITTFEYNGLRQLVKTTDPANRSVAFDWCKCGDMKSLTDPLGRTTRWVHDVQGRVTAKEYADGSKINYLYEPQTSRLAQRIDEKNQTTLYSYYLDDTLRSVSYPDAPIATPTVNYTYDSLFNRIASMTDGIGTTNYSYLPITGGASQGAGQLASVDGPWSNDTITYTYDKLGRPTNRSINGTAETAVFDAAGRPSSVTNPLGTFTYAYVPNTFRLASVSHSAGMSTVFSYLGNAQDRRLSRIRNLKPGGTTPISTFDYTYDAEGRIQNWTQQNDTASAQTWELSYDSADQLAAAVVKQGATTLKSSAWEYDTASNRTKETINSVASNFSYNTLNELTNASTTLTPATYEWDAENRLTAVNQGTARTEFAYDGLGRRVKITEKTNGTVTSAVTYLWCGLQICEGRDAAGTTVQQRYYAQGFQGVSGSPTGIHLYTFDHLGSIREVVDTAGTLKERISYDAWGQPSFSNATPLASFAFTGHFWHGRSGLHLAPYRAYAAGQGRWVSRDPSGELGGSNLLAYTENGPINRYDPLGLDWLDDTSDWITRGGATNFFYGVADSLTFGQASNVAQWAGFAQNLDKCSASYNAGQITGFAVGLLAGGYSVVNSVSRLSRITKFTNGRFYMSGRRGAVAARDVLGPFYLGKWKWRRGWVGALFMGGSAVNSKGHGLVHSAISRVDAESNDECSCRR